MVTFHNHLLKILLLENWLPSELRYWHPV
jgi:hypothetical protein